MAPDRTDIFEAIAPLVSAGGALHWLRPESKAPADKAWSIAPVATLERLQKTYTAGANVGIRLGEPSCLSGLYLHLIDLDIRDPARAGDAWARLLELWPQARRFPSVVSGSGGESRHIYFLTARPFRSKKLARSAGFTMVSDGSKGREVKKHDWEIELFGTGKQAVLPPSIHPDSGRPYVWERPLDLEMVDLGAGPCVPVETVRGWTAQVPHEAATDDGELKPSLGMTADEARKILADLPLGAWCDDRDGWLQAGMALHHEFDGSDAGFELWSEFSRQSEKFDAKDQARVWKSFRERPNSVRMATLKKAAQLARFESMFEEADEPPQPNPAPDSGGAIMLEDDLMADLAEDDLMADAGEPPTQDATAWTSKLDLTEAGAIKPSLHNVTLIVANDPRTIGVMGMNLFTQEVVMRRAPGVLTPARPLRKGAKQLRGPIWELRDPVNGDLWTDEKDDSIRDLIEAPKRQGGYAIKVSDRDLKAAVNLAARRHEFHPVRDYLKALEWDGRERLDSFFVRFLGVADTPYGREVARLTLLAGVARAFHPGHKFDFVPILEGLQGKRKSTFIRILGLHWPGELEGNFGDRKAMVEKMQGAFVLEIPELSAFSRSEVLEIKSFLSAPEDRVRLAYAHRAKVYPRQCIFLGSTNDREYLRDSTGGRRFWPLLCSVAEIDTDAFAAEVDQLWAEAVAVYRAMRAAQPRGNLPLYLRGEALREAEALQETRRQETAEDGLAGTIAAWLDQPVAPDFDDEDLIGLARTRHETCLLEVWTSCLGRDRASYRQADAQMLGRAMKLVPGWERLGTPRHMGERWGVQRAYRRLDASLAD